MGEIPASTDPRDGTRTVCAQWEPHITRPPAGAQTSTRDAPSPVLLVTSSRKTRNQTLSAVPLDVWSSPPTSSVSSATSSDVTSTITSTEPEDSTSTDRRPFSPPPTTLCHLSTISSTTTTPCTPLLPSS